ncbi:hypothetical protein MP638_002642, partial [Amoeboaphelidium occidentale]
MDEELSRTINEALLLKEAGKLDHAFSKFTTAAAKCIELTLGLKNRPVATDSTQELQELLRLVLKLSRNCALQAADSVDGVLLNESSEPVSVAAVTASEEKLQQERVPEKRKIPFVPLSNLTIDKSETRRKLETLKARFDELHGDETDNAKLQELRQVSNEIAILEGNLSRMEVSINRALSFKSLVQWDVSLLARQLTVVTVRLVRGLMKDGVSESFKCMILEAALNDYSCTVPLNGKFGLLNDPKRVAKPLMPLLDFYYFVRNTFSGYLLNDSSIPRLINPTRIEIKEYLKARSQLVSFVLRLIEELFLLRNYHLAAAITNGLILPPLRRLKTTLWDTLQPNDKKLYNEFISLFSQHASNTDKTGYGYAKYKLMVLDQTKVVKQYCEIMDAIPDTTLDLVHKKIQKDYQIIAIPWILQSTHELCHIYHEHAVSKISFGSCNLSDFHYYLSLLSPSGTEKARNVFEVLDSCSREHLSNIVLPAIDKNTAKKLQEQIPKHFIPDLKSLKNENLECEHWILSRSYPSPKELWQSSFECEPEKAGGEYEEESYVDYE